MGDHCARLHIRKSRIPKQPIHVFCRDSAGDGPQTIQSPARSRIVTHSSTAVWATRSFAQLSTINAIGTGLKNTNKRLTHPNEFLKEGQEVKVKLLGFDDRGKVRLGMKMVDQETGAEIAEIAAEA